MNNSEMKVYRPSTMRSIVDAIVQSLCAIAVLTIVFAFLLSVKSPLGAMVPSVFFYSIVASIAAISTAMNFKFTRSITLSQNGISGKTYMGFGRSGFPIHDIDQTKSKKRSIINRSTGTRVIHSKSGEMIVFQQRIFTATDAKEILSRCNI